MSTGLVAVTAVGRDRPGIVAGVTKALFEADCNLADVTSTLLSGQFAMVLVVQTPEGLTAERLETAMTPTAEELGLVITVRAIEEGAHEVVPPTHMVAVYGADRPGIVYQITDLLAREGANITDLTSRVIGDEEHPVYALMLEVVLDDAERIEGELSDLASEMGVDVSVHPIEVDIL